MIEIPFLIENVRIPAGDKTMWIEYTLQDDDGNIIDLTGHTLQGKLVDMNGIEQTGAIIVENSEQGFRVQIDANVLLPGKYTAVVRDNTDDITLVQYKIHVEESI